MDEESLTVDIHGLGAGGEGVGTLADGRTVFVPRTAVGDRVVVALDREKKRWARGHVVEHLVQSPDRRSAPCPRYDECGGCQLQHIDYDAQLNAKKARIESALRRIGGLQTKVERILPSPKETEYRTRVRFHVKRGPQGRVSGGFHRAGSPGSIVDIGSECLVLAPDLSAAWNALRLAWDGGARLLPRGDDLDVLLRSMAGGVAATILGGTAWPHAARLAKAVPEVVAWWWLPTGERDFQHMAGTETVAEQWNGEHLEIGASGFLQANRDGATLLWDLLAREVGVPTGKRIVDAYCGTGVFGRLLARHGAEVVGVELDRNAAQTARTGAPKGFTVRVGRVERLLPELLPADCLVANPPRQGMAEEAVRALNADPPDRVLYVSCDPATLARDLVRMADRYEIIRLQALDLFPQTAHVETLVTAIKRTAGGPSS